MEDTKQAQAARLMQRIAKGYQTFCVLLVNTALLFAVIVGVLGAWFPQDRFYWNWNSPSGKTISERFDASHYYLVSPEQVQGIFAEFDQFGLSGQWQSSQWTGLTSREAHGTYLNVDSEGRRATSPPAPSGDGKPPFVVWAFGGSTMFGWGLPDQHTIPSQLQAELQARLPDRQVRVVNYGVPSFTSSQEAALFVAALRDQPERPDVAIFLDGLNDLTLEADQPDQFAANLRTRAAWEESLGRLSAPAPWIGITPNFPLFRAAYQTGMIKAASFRDDNQPLSVERVGPLVERYSANRAIIRGAASGFDVTTLFLAQPVPQWLKRNRRDYQNGPYKEFIAQLNAAPAPDTIDLTASLAGLDPDTAMTVEPLGTHYSDAAVAWMVTQIADSIVSRVRP